MCTAGTGVTKVISPRRQKHLLPLMFLPPLYSTTYIRHCPLFGGVRVSSMRATAAVKQTSDRVIASAKRRATGGNYPAHNRPYCRAVASLDSRKSRNSFPGIDKKKIETRDSRVSLTSPEPTISCLPTV